MGLRFRKSINLGGGFRINLSKSGIGYSWGLKGFRVTKKAKGGARYTASVPGTGVSYTRETSSMFGKSERKQNNTRYYQQPPSAVNDSNLYNEREISNGNVKDIHSDGMEEMIASANKSLKLNKYATILLVISAILGCSFPYFFIAAAVFLILKIYIKKKGIIELEYTIDEEQRASINERLSPLKKIASSECIWRITQSSSVLNRKYSSGAGETIKRVHCSALKNLPFPFKSNEKAVCFKSGKETFIFLPDKFFIIQKGKLGALNYSDLTYTVNGVRFVESGTVPEDAKIVGDTWKYVNKNGTPDKRFGDNRQLPICLYGELAIRSKTGEVNTVLMFSKYDAR